MTLDTSIWMYFIERPSAMPPYTKAANLTVLVAARAALLSKPFPLSPADTRALNRIEGELDLYDWRKVKQAIDALKAKQQQSAEVA